MGLFTNLLRKSTKDFFNRHRKWLIGLTLILSLVIGLNFLANYYVDKILSKLIKEFVQKKSNGFYTVEFDKIAYVLNNGRFFMTDFKFEINPEQQQIEYANLDKNYIYSATIPRLHIDIIDFWSIFVSQKLEIIGVEIDSPNIKIINLNKNKTPKKISFEAGNLYEVLSGHLNELKINDFLISDGSFDYETYRGPDYDNFKVKGVRFEVRNFKVNESANKRKDKFFYTDDISLEIRDQLLFLKDSIHKVTFGRFYISTRRNEFGFKDFKLMRREKPLTDKNTHDHYEVTVPNLRFSGIDFLSAYNDNLLKIDSIQIEDPIIYINKRTRSNQNDTTKNKILGVVMNYNEYLMVNNFKLANANLVFTDETREQSKKYSINHISAFVTDIKIETVPDEKEKYSFDFTKMDMIVKDFATMLPDSINTMTFDELSASSEPYKIKLTNLKIEPDSADSSTKKSQIYLNFPYTELSGFDIPMAINKDTFIIKELYLENPDFKIIPAGNKKSKKQKISPAGLFGIYPRLQSFSKLFILNKLNISNGRFNIEKSPQASKNDFSFNHINLLIENVEVDSLTNTNDDVFGSAELKLSLNNSFVKLNAGTVGIGNLNFASKSGRLKIDSLNVAVDSSATNKMLRISFPSLLVKGIDPNQILFDNKVMLDTLNFQDVAIQYDLTEKSDSIKKTPKKTSNDFPLLSINHLIANKVDLNLRAKGLPLFLAEDIAFNISKIVVDRSLSDNPLNQFDYDKINLISMDNYKFYLTKQDHLIEADRISWTNHNSTFSMENIHLKPNGNPDNKYNINVPNVSMTGIDLKGVLKGSYYYGDEILIEHPQIDLKLSAGRQENPTNLDLGFIPLLLRNKYLGAKANTFSIKNATLNVHQKVETDSLLIEADNLNLLVYNFEVDSMTEMVPDHFLFANDVRMEGDYLSAYHQSNSDFFNINHYFISTKDGDIRLNGIYVATNTKNEYPEKDKLKFTADNLSLQNLDFYDFTQNQTLDMAEIRIDHAQLNLSPGIDKVKKEDIELKSKDFPNDSLLLNSISEILKNNKIFNQKQKAEPQENSKVKSKEFLFDTLLLKSIDIDRILITDSKANIENSDGSGKGLVIPEIWFLAEKVKYDPILALDSNRIFYSDNLKAIITNFNYVLPDNLSSIRVDELVLNSKDSTILAKNFALIPLVDRYDYGPAKGFQSTWLKIENNSISLDKVDFLSIINKRSFNAQSLNVNKIDISVFRDKRVPFPEWQRRPLPQTGLRKMKFTINVDTVILHDGYISYQEHSEKALATGEVFFSDLNATILNLTNDSLRTLFHPKTRIGVTADVFGKGHMKAEFTFDLVNMDNIHSYGAEVGPFDLTEFNRILVPSASVQISGGQSESIIMSAKADEDYSYGEMKFQYKDLKIALLNRETETPKGLGNALGSFFANTFIIKSNNPRNFVLRKGDIFFERDKKRAIFNYWTKTFLSGVVSSIGAANNKKKIKKMQEENLKKIKKQKALESSL